MADYDDEPKGILFKNDRKDSGQHPDYTGECQVRGASFWLSAWVRENKRGRKYLGLSLRPKHADERNGRAPAL
jgi:hypothetical protein